jgi:hypothetical protein
MITVHVYYANQLLFRKENVTFDVANRTPRVIMLEYGPEYYNGAYIHWKENKSSGWYRGDMTPIETEGVPAETRVAHFLIQ